MGPRFLYLHGFASGPRSQKATALAAHYARHGVTLERLDLRVPSLERLRLSQMMSTVRAAVGGPSERAVLFGSSLGGLCAARVAEADARVCALVLLAPAFQLMERWRARLGDAGWQAWQASGWLEIDDHAENQKARVDFGFAVDVAATDTGWPDVRVPTLIVHGTRDESVDVALSRAFARDRRHVRLVELDDDHGLTASLGRIAAEADRFLAPFGV